MRAEPLTHGSLFSGIGGFDLGFERAGFKTIWQVEKNFFCRKILERHFGETQRFIDVRNCGAHNLQRVDVITGGDPCQRNSNAWRHGSGDDSPAYEFIRIVADLRPSIVVRENPAVLRADAPWPWERFRRELDRLGYAVVPFRLRACCLGAHHQRERMFLLAALPDAHGAGLEGDEREILERAREWRSNADFARSDRRNPEAGVCGRTHAIPNRVDRLRSLGNAISPEVAYWIAWQIRRALECQKPSEAVGAEISSSSKTR